MFDKTAGLWYLGTCQPQEGLKLGRLLHYLKNRFDGWDIGVVPSNTDCCVNLLYVFVVDVECAWSLLKKKKSGSVKSGVKVFVLLFYLLFEDIWYQYLLL